MLEQWFTKEGIAIIFAGISTLGILVFKETIQSLVSSIWFRINSKFEEGDLVVIDDKEAVINKVGLLETTFSYVNDVLYKEGECSKRKKLWRVVPNDRIKFLKIEIIVHQGV